MERWFVVSLGLSDLQSAWRIAATLNRDSRISNLCANVQCNNFQSVYRRVHKFLSEGVLSKHLIVPLELLPGPVSTAILTKHQKIRQPCITKAPRPIITYYSYIGSPVEVHYVFEECSSVEDYINTSACKLEFCGRLHETAVPLESLEGLKLVLSSTKPPTNSKVFVDAVDADIAIDIFRLSNPPFKNSWKTRDLLEALRQRLGVKNVKYHYYAHLYKALSLHYAVRNHGDFLIILANAPTPRELERILIALLENGFIAGIWQVHYYSKTPLTALVYSWGYINKFIEPEYVHESITGVSYVVFPVIGVYHGAPGT